VWSAVICKPRGWGDGKQDSSCGNMRMKTLSTVADGGGGAMALHNIISRSDFLYMCCVVWNVKTCSRAFFFSVSFFASATNIQIKIMKF
jgi:hypothetical protein